MKNTFLDYGFSEKEITDRVDGAFHDIFEGPDRFYFDGPDGSGYLMDTGNCDARTEGISYGMMMSVMMDRQDYFDRLWKFAVEFMYMDEGPMKGYFAWSVAPDGKKNAWGPAPDGEEFFAAALLFASERWGDRDGIFRYSEWARKILRACIHSEIPMWTADSALIRFVPGCGFSDPSYHLMHFYRIFSMKADEGDRDFWSRAENASRKYLAKSCSPETGMSPEYAGFDGNPEHKGPPEGHGDFYSDSYRTGANIGLDALWFGKNDELTERADRLVEFFADIPTENFMKYRTDGTPLGEKALHPVGLLAALAQTTPACSEKAAEAAEKIVRRFWNTPTRKGCRRYYDNCLYMFAMLALSGKYTYEF